MNPPSGRTQRWGPTLLIAATLMLYFFVSRPAAAPAGWGDDYEAALKDAVATGRHVVIAFYSEGCPPCAAMDRMVLGTPEVREALLGYLPVRLDVNRQREPARRYQVLATPTFVVTDEAGRPLAQREGYLSKEEFVAFLKENAPPIAK
jgi:thioredoxin-related protein